MLSLPALSGPRFRRLLLAIALSVGAPAAASEAFDAQTRSDLQSIISRQLAAFDQGDAKAAEGFAAPGIQQLFPEPDRFMAMVKAHYGALIHSRSTQFLDALPSPHGPLQRVTVVAADGTVWSAIYSFERVEGQWRISGCGLKKDDTQQEI